jgi:hypothetical protein
MKSNYEGLKKIDMMEIEIYKIVKKGNGYSFAIIKSFNMWLIQHRIN